MILYLVFGVGMYVGLCLNNPDSFIDATAAGLIRGLILGILFWPIGIVMRMFMIMADDKKPKRKKK